MFKRKNEMEYICYKCDCGCNFAIHSFSDCNDLKCPACWDDTGIKTTNEIIKKERLSHE